MRSFGLGALLLAAALAAHGQPMQEPPQSYLDVPLHPRVAFKPEQVRESIIVAGGRRNWKFEDAGPGKLIGTLNVRGKHSIVVELTYAADRYSIVYKDSINMRYRGGLIHPHYNRWVRELSEAFVAELALVATTNPQATMAIPPAPPVTGMPASVSFPRAGDTWSYRMAPKGKTAHRVVSYTVTIEQASQDEITDRITMDGQAPLVRRHEPQPVTLLESGWATEVSPYLVAFGKEAKLRSTEAHSADRRICTVSWECQHRAQVMGNESIRVPAGTFDVVKLVVEQSWTSPSLATVGLMGPREIGRRTITVWYSPLLRRAVRFESRGTPSAWLETQFDVELTSFKLN